MNTYQLIVAGMVFSLLIALAVVLFYIRYRRRLTVQELEMSRAEIAHQKELLRAIIRSQEEERKRIGMNLHDEVGTALSALRIMLERQDPAESGNRELALKCRSIIDRVIADVRNISHDLSPIRTGTYDFTDALEDLCETVNQSGKLHIDLQMDAPEALKRLEENDVLALYRVLSELVNNTIRHAKASSITLGFSSAPGSLHIHYRDNGIGLPAIAGRKNGMGMQNIESRLNMIGAAFTIDEMPGGFGMQLKINA